jgi:molybdate/tungstate transport system permease protein
MNWLRVIAIVSLAVLNVPVVVLLYDGFGPLRSSSGYTYGVFRSIELTLLSSAIASFVCVVIFTPLAFYLARNESKLGETLADIPATIPHPIIGIAILVLFSPLTPFGSFLESIGINVFDTLLGLVIALVVVSAPIYIKALQPFFQSMNRSHENFALGLGASRLKTFASVVLPNSSRGILSASLISMSRAMSEFGSIAIVAYEIVSPKAFFGVSPASVYIFNLYTYSGLEGAVTASAVMIVVSVSVMVALRFVGLGKLPRRSISVEPRPAI